MNDFCSLLFKGDSFSFLASLQTVPIVFLLDVVVTDDVLADDGVVDGVVVHADAQKCDVVADGLNVAEDADSQ